MLRSTRSPGSFLSGVGLVVALAACGAAPPEAPATPAAAAPSAPSAAAVPPPAGAPGASPSAAAPAKAAERGYASILGVERLKAFLADPKVVVIDVRSSDDYAKGHIPGAISLHGELWRTPGAKPPKASHDMFVKADGSIDAAKYEALLGGAGISHDNKVIVYGNHGGKADGSVPVTVLLALGHREVGFVDGIGLDQWKAAGNAVATEPKKLAATTYRAAPVSGFLVSLEQMKKHVAAKDVLFVDTRTPGEFAGTDARDNKKPGHLPGAVNVPVDELFNKDKTTVAPSQARTIFTQKGVTPDKKIVVYCQTGTRAAHNLMVLRELGYSNVALYDGSFQEWGNRDDTAVEK